LSSCEETDTAHLVGLGRLTPPDAPVAAARWSSRAPPRRPRAPPVGAAVHHLLPRTGAAIAGHLPRKNKRERALWIKRKEMNAVKVKEEERKRKEKMKEKERKEKIIIIGDKKLLFIF
jgi:hypothetical protein